MGAEAVMALMEAKEDTIPCVVSLDGNQVWLHFTQTNEVVFILNLFDRLFVFL